MNEQRRVFLLIGIGFVLAFISAELPFPWWIVLIVIAAGVVLIGGWPFWKDMLTALWYVITNKKD